MANYTARVYDVLRYYNDNDINGGYENIEQAIENHWNDVFDLDIWNTWDSSYKGTLCQKILRHYLMYEIGAETVSLWKIQLNSRLSEIMPKYNVMYRNIEKAYTNFFQDVDYTETTKRTTAETEQKDGTVNGTATETVNGSAETTQNTSGATDTTNNGKTVTEGTADGTSKTNTTNSGSATNDTDGWQASSDTPQGTLSGLEDNNYLSNAVHNYGKSDSTTNTQADSTGETSNTTNTSAEVTAEQNTKTETETNTDATTKQDTSSTTEQTTTDNTDRNTTEDYVKTVIGKLGSQNNATLFNDIVKNLVNIDELIINDLKDCFILLWQ